MPYPSSAPHNSRHGPLVDFVPTGGKLSALAVAGGRRSWRRALAGLGGVVLVQAAFGVPVGELAHHYGFDPHVGLLRGWALALPAAAVWWLVRPAPFTVLVTPAPPRALPQAG